MIADTAKTERDREVADSAPPATSRVAVTSAVVVAVIAGAVALGFVIVKAYGIVLTLFGAIVLAEAVRPLVDRLSTRVPRAAAVTIVFVAVVILIVLSWFIPLRDLAPQFEAFRRAIPGYLALTAQLIAHIKEQHQDLLGDAPALSAPIGQIVQALLGAGIGVAGFVSTLALALVLAVFWLASSDALRAFLLTLVGPKTREEADALFRELGSRVGGYAAGTIMRGAILAVGSALVFSLLRTPYPIVLGLLQGLLLVIPYVGTFIGVLIVAVVVLPTQGWLSAATAMAAMGLVATLEGSFVAPLVFKQRLNIDPLSTTLAVAIGGTLFGMAGVVLAVPAAAVLQTLVIRVLAPAIRRSQRDT